MLIVTPAPLFVVVAVTVRSSWELASEQGARLIAMSQDASLVGGCLTHICIVQLISATHARS